MVDTDEIGQFGRRAQAVHPPGIAVGRMPVPVVQRVAPELAIFGKIIGRHAGDRFRAAVTVDFKDLGMRPGIGAVERNVDRHVAEQADAVRVGVIAQPLPLFEKEELQHLDIGDLRIGHVHRVHEDRDVAAASRRTKRDSQSGHGRSLCCVLRMR